MAEEQDNNKMADGQGQVYYSVLVNGVLALLLSCLISSCSSQTNGDIKLVSQAGVGEVEGIPEIYYNGEWGTLQIQDADPSNVEHNGASQVICRQLGADDGKASSSRIEPLSNFVPVRLFVEGCTYMSDPLQSKSHILRCNPLQVDKGYVLEYGHKRDLIVSCLWKESGAPRYDTQVRLVHNGSSYASSGFVEVYLNGSWGPVCNLGRYDADTACRQLGYTNAVGHGSSVNHDFQPESAKLDNFTCSSSSGCLRNCFTYPSPDYSASCSNYSWVNCTFDESKLESSSEEICSQSDSSPTPELTKPPSQNSTTTAPSHDLLNSHTFLIVIIVAGVTGLLLLAAVITSVCCCCCCVRRCPFYKLTYKIRSGPLYEEVNDDEVRITPKRGRLMPKEFDEMH